MNGLLPIFVSQGEYYSPLLSRCWASTCSCLSPVTDIGPPLLSSWLSIGRRHTCPLLPCTTPFAVVTNKHTTLGSVVGMAARCKLRAQCAPTVCRTCPHMPRGPIHCIAITYPLDMRFFATEPTDPVLKNTRCVYKDYNWTKRTCPNVKLTIYRYFVSK